MSDSAVTVPKSGTASVEVTLDVPAATVGGSRANPPADFDAFHDVAGLITLTPTSSSSNRGIGLRVPYYLVPRAAANVNTSLSLKHGATAGIANVQNANSPITATADFYAWGLESRNRHLGRIDLRAAGVLSFDAGGGDPVIVFAINTFVGWSTPEQQEFDVLIDSNNGGTPDYAVFSVDLGLITHQRSIDSAVIPPIQLAPRGENVGTFGAANATACRGERSQCVRRESRRTSKPEAAWKGAYDARANLVADPSAGGGDRCFFVGL